MYISSSRRIASKTFADRLLGLFVWILCGPFLRLQAHWTIGIANREKFPCECRIDQKQIQKTMRSHTFRVWSAFGKYCKAGSNTNIQIYCVIVQRAEEIITIRMLNAEDHPEEDENYQGLIEVQKHQQRNHSAKGKCEKSIAM